MHDDRNLVEKRIERALDVVPAERIVITPDGEGSFLVVENYKLPGPLAESMEQVIEMKPDLIISDILLPGKDGMVITETLKNDVRTSHIPIIILTARGSMEQQIEGLSLNADAYIVKPFNIRYLEENIKSLLRNRESLKGHYTSELLPDSSRNAPSRLERKFINEFSAIIESNISNEDFTVNDICTALGISRVQLYRKVKAVLGCNVNEYILNVRMQRAKYLLLNEDLSIAEVSYKVGFSSAAYFSTVMKSRLGVTPTEFRSNGSSTTPQTIHHKRPTGKTGT